MNWNKDKSITLTMVCIAVFAAVMAVCLVFGGRIVSAFGAVRGFSEANIRRMMVTCYVSALPAGTVLWKMWKVLGRIKTGEVFLEENAKDLRLVSWACGAETLICLVSCLYYRPFVLVAVAAAFMMLIVRIVKNIIQQAVSMKSELDLTI